MTTPEVKPEVTLLPTERHLEKLPSAFPELTSAEKMSDWGKELLIGRSLARELDLYRAATAFKRAQILLGDGDEKRRQEIFYDLLLSYYLAGKYDSCVETYEKMNFALHSDFVASREFLLMLHDAYLRRGERPRAAAVIDLIEKKSPELAKNVDLYQATITYNFDYPGLEKLSNIYSKYKKSPTTAGTLNAVLPGAGYWYVGQKQTAITSFLINALFIAATYQFITHDQLAAGIITGSMEMGWYIGGINGARLAAHQYNKTYATGLAQEECHRAKLFPLLQFQYAF